MESIRQKQIGEMLRRYFSMILTEEGALIYGRDKLVTVTQVRMTPDLLIANTYISVYGTEYKQEVILEMEEHLHHLQLVLGRKIGKQLRRMPQLVLHLDDTVDEMYRVSALLDRIEGEDKEKSE
jgi:ribosome-binding factor A